MTMNARSAHFCSRLSISLSKTSVVKRLLNLGVLVIAGSSGWEWQAAMSLIPAGAH